MERVVLGGNRWSIPILKKKSKFVFPFLLFLRSLLALSPALLAFEFEL